MAKLDRVQLTAVLQTSGILPCLVERADQKALRGELTARTQFDKSYKGAISIDECSPDGRYIVITNNGNTVC